ncbi:MAG TPA: hypothetical protein VHE54_15530 [Puia sp.]|nr:hypothetical protein [Puia sp.]
MRKQLIIILLLAFSFMQGVGQAHVQTTTLYQTPSGKTISLSFGAVSQAGDLIVVHLDWDNQSRSVASVTDNNGNTYRLINGPRNWNGTNYRAALYYAYNITGGAVVKVTATLNNSPTSFLQMYISEYSGIATSIDPLDQHSDNASNTAAVSSGSKTTTFSNELIYGASIGAAGLLTKGAGFTLRSSANQNIIEDRNVTSAGSYSTNFASAGGNWVAQLATFIATSSVLPVSLSSFTERCRNNTTELEWTTATETNSESFTVEGSADGTLFADIASIRAAGHSSVPQHYSYTVDVTRQALTWFRLRQTGIDGRFAYSQVIAATGCPVKPSGIKIFPSPSDGHLLSGSIDGQPGAAYTLDIFDNGGKILYHTSINAGRFRLTLPVPLTTGVFFARFASPVSTSVLPFTVKP